MRVILIVLDSVGIGALPDATLYGDEGSDTLGNIVRAVGSLDLPNLASLGLGNLVSGASPEDLAPVSCSLKQAVVTLGPGSPGLTLARSLPGIPPSVPLGACGRMALRSPGKDTTTGHWELSGIILTLPFRTYPDGFPPKIISEFERRIGRRVLGNKAASGTEIIEELGEEHIRTGRPIVYTSADSVFQVACHEEVVPLDTLYSWCEIAREMLVGDDLVGRVIARPFVGKPGSFSRTAGRKDYSLSPPKPSLLDYAQRGGVKVTAIGKIHDIFAGQGIDKSIHTSSNAEGVEAIMDEVRAGGGPPGGVAGSGRSVRVAAEVGGPPERAIGSGGSTRVAAEAGGPPVRAIGTGSELIFANLVDFDMLYGHRNDVHGYAKALKEFDDALACILTLIRDTDILIITADHGCDPTTPSTDHSREYVPLLMYGTLLRPGVVLEDRASLADLGATIAEIMGIRYGGAGESFAGEVLKNRPCAVDTRNRQVMDRQLGLGDSVNQPVGDTKPRSRGGAPNGGRVHSASYKG